VRRQLAPAPEPHCREDRNDERRAWWSQSADAAAAAGPSGRVHRTPL